MKNKIYKFVQENILRNVWGEAGVNLSECSSQEQSSRAVFKEIEHNRFTP